MYIFKFSSLQFSECIKIRPEWISFITNKRNRLNYWIDHKILSFMNKN